MKRLVIYLHGRGGSPEEAEHYKVLLPSCDILGFDYKSQTPWEAKKEFPIYFDSHSRGYDSTILIAASIGAYFAMSSLSDRQVDKALFISPVVDMENLIKNMMLWANVSEQELSERKEIATGFGETLSWDYLCYVRTHPIRFNVPTCILYGEKDNLTSIETMSEFADRNGAKISVMKDGGHWFHTDEQMAFLADWVRESVL